MPASIHGSDVSRRSFATGAERPNRTAEPMAMRTAEMSITLTTRRSATRRYYSKRPPWGALACMLILASADPLIRVLAASQTKGLQERRKNVFVRRDEKPGLPGIAVEGEIGSRADDDHGSALRSLARVQ